MNITKPTFSPDGAEKYTILKSYNDFYSIDSKKVSSALNGKHSNKKSLPLTVLSVAFKEHYLHGVSKSSFLAGGYSFVELEYHYERSFTEIEGVIFDIYYRDTGKIVAKVYERIQLEKNGNIKIHILYDPRDLNYRQLDIHPNMILGSSPELNRIVELIKPFVSVLQESIIRLPSYEELDISSPIETDEIVFLPIECTYNSKYFSRIFLLRNHLIENTIISCFDMIQYQIPVKADNESLILLIYGTHALESIMIPEMLKSPLGISMCDSTDEIIRERSPIIHSILSIREIIKTFSNTDSLAYQPVYLEYKQLVSALYSWIDGNIKKAKKEYDRSEFSQVKWVSEYKLYALIKFWHQEAVFQYSPTWLNGQSIDIYLPEESIGIEYQGKQHFEPIDYFGGEEKLLENARRDQTKLRICEDHGITLYYWPYDRHVSFSAVSDFLSESAEKVYSQLEKHKKIPVTSVLEKDQTYTQAEREKKQEHKKAIQHSQQEVIRQYTISGDYLAEFSSIKNAAINSDISMSSIQKCLAGERKTAGGYVWRREKHAWTPQKIDVTIDKISNKAPIENSGLPKRVVQIDIITGEVIQIFGSIGQAAKSIGINSKGIHDVIKGKQKTAGGYFWQLAD